MLTMLALSLALAAPVVGTADTAAVASARIAAQARVELGPVGFDGHDGATSVELAKVTALGADALPLLLEMARSASPVARVAAAAGLIGRAEPETLAAVAVLAQDTATVSVRLGCLGTSSTVAAEVQRAHDQFRP